jgi:hypothetical protein
MTIVSYKKKFWHDETKRWVWLNFFAICCDGCGTTVELFTSQFERALVEVDIRKWHVCPFDYGFPLNIDDPSSAIGYEHFCSTDCLDPPEWG